MIATVDKLHYKRNTSTISATAENRYWRETAKLRSVCSIMGNYETIRRVFDKTQTDSFFHREACEINIVFIP